MVLGLFDQLQIFRLLYLIELVGFLSGLGLLELQHLIYPRLLAGFGMLVVLTNLSFIEFQVRYLAFFHLFTVIDTFRLFWMGSLQDNIQLMLEFLKASVLVLHFSYTFPTLMIFLMMLSEIYILLKILLSTLNVIMYLISGCQNCFLNKILWTGVRSGLLISMMEKLNCFLVTRLTTLM